MNALQKFKESFDPVLKNYVDQKIAVFLKDTDDPFILNLVNHSRKLVENGGKRIRPYIAYLMYKSSGGTNEQEALKLVTSLEIFHSFALVHDDVMDKGAERRGIQTIHEYVKETLEKENISGDLSHIGNSQAILVGDLLLAWALEVFDESGFDKNKLVRTKEYFYKMINDVILGQIIDIDLSVRENFPKEMIDKKNRLKSASYTFIRPLQIGASLVKIDGATEKFCEELGLQLGLAYQMQDDLMDMSEDASGNQKNFSAGKTVEEIKKDIETHLNTAMKIIEKSEIEEKYKQEFYEMIKELRNRKN
jgi:geranylgeranyl diphosphate synthase type I